jgi:hypothetical protein
MSWDRLIRERTQGGNDDDGFEDRHLTLAICPQRGLVIRVPSHDYSQLIALLDGLVQGCAATPARHAGMFGDFLAVLAGAVTSSTSRFRRGHGGVAYAPIVDHNM